MRRPLSRCLYAPQTDLLGSSCRTGNLRFNLPVAVDPYNGTHAAAAFGPACPQQSISRLPIIPGLDQEGINLLANGTYEVIAPSAEDCKFSLTCAIPSSDADGTEPVGLSINVVVPAGTEPGAKLPVAVVSIVDYHIY